MEKGRFRPKEAYKLFRARIPHNPVGIRFQPSESTEDIALQRKWFAVFRLDKSWKDMTKERKRLHELITILSGFGHTKGLWEFDTVNSALDCFVENPGVYNSVILFNFQGLKGRWYALGNPLHFDSSLLNYYRRGRVPRKFKAGTITLTSKDIQNVRSRMDKKRGTPNYNVQALQKLLQKRLERRIITEFFHLRQANTKAGEAQDESIR